MIAFALVLTAAGLVTAIYLLIYACENLLALTGALLMAHLALTTGGGWIGAVGAGLAAFAAISIAFRLTFGLIRSWPIRLGLLAAIALPGWLAGFCLVDAILRPAIPSPCWRLPIAFLVAVMIATDAVRRHVSLQTAA